MENETAAHPLERFPHLTQRLTLPLTGIPVLIRRLDVEAFTLDGMRTALSIPALQQVVAEFASEAAEHQKRSAKPGSKGARPRGELPPEVMMEVEKQATRNMLRGALLRPTLEELVAEYGGSLDSPDLGMASDYSYLTRAVDTFSNTKPGEAELTAARTFLVPESGAAVGPGGEVRQTPE